MSHVDLGAGHRHYYGLRVLVIHNPGGWRDEHSLQRLQTLCRAANAAVDDPECKERLGAIEDYGCELYSDGDHQKWARGHLSGTDHLRLKILRELNAFNEHLSCLEVMRDTSGEKAAPRSLRLE
jgi:hypothetical protein